MTRINTTKTNSKFCKAIKQKGSKNVSFCAGLLRSRNWQIQLREMIVDWPDSVRFWSMLRDWHRGMRSRTQKVAQGWCRQSVEMRLFIQLIATLSAQQLPVANHISTQSPVATPSVSPELCDLSPKLIGPRLPTPLAADWPALRSLGTAQQLLSS